MSPKRTQAIRTRGPATSITIEGEIVKAFHAVVPINDVKLDPANPRIQHAVKQRGTAFTSSREALAKLIQEQPGSSDLFRHIRDNGGLTDPLHVRADGSVIEGNCRAASYIRLHKIKPHDPRWQTIPVICLPDITERQVAVLQANFHVAGKNKWGAYEKARHIHYMHTMMSMTARDIAKAIGSKTPTVESQLAAYGTMTDLVIPNVTSGDARKKWSHCEEFHRNKDLKKYREDPANVKEFAELVVANKLGHGSNVRKLATILQNKRATKALKKYGIKKAIEVLGRTDPTVDSKLLKKLKEVTTLLSKAEQKDLQQIRERKSAQKILKNLQTALLRAAQVTGVDLG